MNLLTKLRLEREWNGLKYQMRLFAIENNVGDKKKFVQEIKNMYFFRDEISSIIRKLERMESTNAAVPIMAALLNAILMIISQQDQQYSWIAMRDLSELCKRIIQETGTPSEQFEMIAALASMGNNTEENSGN